MVMAAESPKSIRRWREGARNHSIKVLVTSAQILTYLEFSQIGVSRESHRGVV